MRIKNYRWSFAVTNMDKPGREGFLIDKFLSTSTPLNLAGTNLYDFTVSNTAGTYAADRFMIVFRQASVVPVTFTAISANRQPDGSNIVKWHSENELNIDHYETERSGNGSSFVTLGNTNPTNNAGGSASYSYTDNKPLNGDNYYRVKAVSAGGQVQYTAIVKVDAPVKTGLISIYPNPLTDKNLNVKFEHKLAGKYSLELLNPAGQKMHMEFVTVSGNNEVKTLRLNYMPAAGSYRLIIISDKGLREVKQLIIK